MSGIERIMTALPPRTRSRVVGWVIDQFSEPAPPAEFEKAWKAAAGVDAPTIDERERSAHHPR